MKSQSWFCRIASVAVGLAIVGTSACAAEPVKIGFIVKQPEQPWFQDVWKAADQAARDKGFTLVKIGAPNGESVMTAIDNLAAQKAQGFVICTPDVKLGPGIVAKAASKHLKMITFADQLVDGKGKVIQNVPFFGISGFEFGRQVGNALLAEIHRRGWDPASVGAIRVAYDQLPTAKERTMGAVDALTKGGLPAANVFDAPTARTDTESAFNAANIVITKQGTFKHWVAFGLNDEAALGAVRAGEGRGFGADQMIAVGIDGSSPAINEFRKPKPTGFIGTIFIDPKPFGYDTSVALDDWIANGKPPPMHVDKPGTLMTRDNVGTLHGN